MSTRFETSLSQSEKALSPWNKKIYLWTQNYNLNGPKACEILCTCSSTLWTDFANTQNVMCMTFNLPSRSLIRHRTVYAVPYDATLVIQSFIVEKSCTWPLSQNFICNPVTLTSDPYCTYQTGHWHGSGFLGDSVNLTWWQSINT